MSTEQGAQENTQAPELETLVTSETPVTEVKPQPLYTDQPVDGQQEPEKTDQSVAEQKEGEGEPENEPEKNDKDGDQEKPEEYDSLDKPDDSLLSDEDMERILAQAKQEGLSKESAQERVKFADELLKDNAYRLSEKHKELSDKWVGECQQDKEIGGEKLKESLQFANKALKKFGTPELFKALNETKYGNNPEVVRVFARIGRAMAPDQLVRPGYHAGGAKPMESLFYPNHNDNE